MPLGEGLQEPLDGGHEPGRHVARHAADANVTGRQARAGDHLKDVHDVLAGGEGILEQRMDGARQVQAVSAHPDQMRGKALQFAHDGPQDLRAGRNLHAQQFLHGQDVPHVVRHSRYVVHAVGVREHLGVGLVLGGLLNARVQVADVGPGIDNRLAVQFHHNAEHAVGAGVLGAHVDDQGVRLGFGRAHRRN
jgi:hypothetical protein